MNLKWNLSRPPPKTLLEDGEAGVKAKDECLARLLLTACVCKADPSRWQQQPEPAGVEKGIDNQPQASVECNYNFCRKHMYQLDSLGMEQSVPATSP